MTVQDFEKGELMKNLTKGQQKVYDYIVECSENNRVPSVRELCDATGFRSTSTVAYHLRALEERGLIEREEGLNRCIRLKNDQPTSRVPLMGRVTAGQPILAVQDIETYIPVPKSVSKGRELFALRVVGESMINAGIYDGDIIIVNRTPTADNGDIVVAMVEDEARGREDDNHIPRARRRAVDSGGGLRQWMRAVQGSFSSARSASCRAA